MSNDICATLDEIEKRLVAVQQSLSRLEKSTDRLSKREDDKKDSKPKNNYNIEITA